MADEFKITIKMEEHQEALDPRQKKAQKIFGEISKTSPLHQESYFFRNLLHDSRKECVDRCVKDYKGNNVSRLERSCFQHCVEARMYTASSSLFAMYLSTAYGKLLHAEAQQQPHELNDKVEFFGNRK